VEYLYVKNLEKYHPNYKDRSLVWCKVYFTMINGDPEFEMLCEIVQWRFVKFIMLQLQTKNGVPLDAEYLSRKGFDFKKRSMSLTLQMLQKFIDVRKNPLHAFDKTCNVDKEEDKEKEEDKDIMLGKPNLDAPVLYLNEKAKTHYDPKNKANRDLVVARFNEGRTLDQFKAVINKKVSEWLTDDKMHKYLRPSTLFSRTHFEEYLNEPIRKPQSLLDKYEVHK
jgi:uncharacterized phage protein (TIGR02220 family)